MDASEFLKWRKALHCTQEEAGQKLGISRATVQNWEKGITRITRAAELACRQLTRRWKQRPTFGPVALIYTDGPLWKELKDPCCTVILESELYCDNEAALQRACSLRLTRTIIYQFIMEKNGGIVWSGPELIRECDRRNQKGE
jgi:transcriptional regulator with XRE-family HTH domain